MHSQAYFCAGTRTHKCTDSKTKMHENAQCSIASNKLHVATLHVYVNWLHVYHSMSMVANQALLSGLHVVRMQNFDAREIMFFCSQRLEINMHISLMKEQSQESGSIPWKSAQKDAKVQVVTLLTLCPIIVCICAANDKAHIFESIMQLLLRTSSGAWPSGIAILASRSPLAPKTGSSKKNNNKVFLIPKTVL